MELQGWPGATRDTGFSLEGRAPSRPFLAPQGLYRMAAEEEAAMTEHGPPSVGHEGPWPSMELQGWPGATRDTGFSLEGRAPSRPFLAPQGLYRMAAEEEAAMTEHGPPSVGHEGPWPSMECRIRWRPRMPARRGGTRSVASVLRALRFVSHGGRRRGGHDRAWPSIGRP